MYKKQHILLYGVEVQVKGLRCVKERHIYQWRALKVMVHKPIITHLVDFTYAFQRERERDITRSLSITIACCVDLCDAV